MGATCIGSHLCWGHLYWRSLVLGITCIGGHLVGGHLCWESLILEITCVGDHLQELLFFLLAYGSRGWNSGHQAWEQGTLPTELAYHPHWIPFLPLNLKIKFSTNEEIPFRGEYPSSDPPVDSQDSCVIPGQCQPLCPHLCHTGSQA